MEGRSGIRAKHCAARTVRVGKQVCLHEYVSVSVMVAYTFIHSLMQTSAEPWNSPESGNPVHRVPALLVLRCAG